MFQSTLPRGERRQHFRSDLLPFNEGSDLACAAPQGSSVSIHAPARGATDEASANAPHSDSFNPRSREGSDQCFGFNLQSFNPRSREGSDTGCTARTLCFNPRSREGSDLAPTRCLKGSDTASTEPPALVSIHAPARGATSGKYQQPFVRTTRPFQSTLPRGERQSTLPRGERLVVSIHAPARGATFILA